MILVLENGVIVERGNHRELIKSDGQYAKMYRQQFWLDELFAGEDEDDMPKEGGPADDAVDLPAL